MRRDDATETQIRAATPDRSTWVEANAGSGKTRVLTDRVARLLLEGVQPQHILCLTYTKAAASEMQNRLFDRLGAWAMMGSKKLSLSLQELGVERQIDEPFLRQSRRLFAQAIEAPGGLKIQTIHSFCSSLLRRFPREAHVSPQFTEIEDRAAALLRQDVVDHMAMSKHKPLVDDLARFYTGEDFEGLTAEILKHPGAFNEQNEGEIFSSLRVHPGGGIGDVLATVFEGSESAFWAELVSILGAQSASYQKIAANLSAIDPQDPREDDLDWLFRTFLFQSGADKGRSKAGRWPQRNHGKVVQAVAPLQHALDAFMDRVEAGHDLMNAQAAASKSVALHRFARAFSSLYSSRKQALGYLDFDDLILRARALLTDPAVAQWVLFRLDGGIDHILVDEAQDTSPVQWDVIEKLAQEFTSGEGARADVTRTLFVVGDKKQSIYSFQGADPGAFDKVRNEFGNRLRAIGSHLHDVPMSFSFRSSPAILNMVDHTFKAGHEDAIGQISLHRAFNSDLPGRVDLWPQVAYVSDEEDKNWSDPVDLPGQKNHNVVLANAVADEIKRLIKEETIPEKDKDTGKIYRRPIRAGDFMVLVRGRTGGIFHHIIQACKSRNLPIAGADRLKVGAELAVRDLAALLNFLALQEDELSLATALKSPLFGWSEQELYTLAQGRGKRGLWQVLRDCERDHPKTLAILHDLRDKADYLRPYELIERILTRHDGRLNLLGRLGQEAEDGIDALLAQALAYEQASTPSLTGFLVWMQEDELEIKRQMDSGGDLIRVMTVHGSKGLEAPIVILPQTTPPRNDVNDELFPSGGSLLWKTKAEDMPQVMRSAKEALLQKRNDEYLRLLYVAMTRAEKWLIVAGAEQKKPTGRGWYDVVSTGMDHAGGVAHEFSLGPGRRYEIGDWTAGDLRSVDRADGTFPDLPDWTVGDAPTPAPARQTLSPSDLGGPKALPSELGMDEETAKAYGSAVHLLLEHLPKHPEDRWDKIAETLLGARFASNALAEAAQVVMSHPELFQPDTLAEISLTAELPFGRIHGTIDRLIVTQDSVTAIDFKTNRAIPGRPEDTPDGLLRQMGAYAAALRQIYPSHEIRSEILWTVDAKRMPLPDMLITEALRILDVP